MVLNSTKQDITAGLPSKESPRISRQAETNRTNRDDVELFSPLRSTAIPETPITSSVRNTVRSSAKPPLSTPVPTTTPSLSSRFSEDHPAKPHRPNDFSTATSDNWASISSQISSTQQSEPPANKVSTKPDVQTNSLFSPLVTVPSTSKIKPQTVQASRFSTELFSPLGAKLPSTDTITDSIRKLSSSSQPSSQPVMKPPSTEPGAISSIPLQGSVESIPFKETPKINLATDNRKGQSLQEPDSLYSNVIKPANNQTVTHTTSTTENSVQFQRQLLQSVVEECLESFRQSVHQDIQNLHLELLRQFQAQQNELLQLFEHYFNPR